MGKVLVNTSCIESAYLTREKSTEYLFMPEVKKKSFFSRKEKILYKAGYWEYGEYRDGLFNFYETIPDEYTEKNGRLIAKAKVEGYTGKHLIFRKRFSSNREAELFCSTHLSNLNLTFEN